MSWSYCSKWMWHFLMFSMNCRDLETISTKGRQSRRELNSADPCFTSLTNVNFLYFMFSPLPAPLSILSLFASLTMVTKSIFTLLNQYQTRLPTPHEPKTNIPSGLKLNKHWAQNSSLSNSLVLHYSSKSSTKIFSFSVNYKRLDNKNPLNLNYKPLYSSPISYPD